MNEYMNKQSEMGTYGGANVLVSLVHNGRVRI